MVRKITHALFSGKRQSEEHIPTSVLGQDVVQIAFDKRFNRMEDMI